MELDVRENYVAIQFDNVLMVATASPRKYLVKNYNNEYDVVPHIHVRFKNLQNGQNRWFIMPIHDNFNATLNTILNTLAFALCKNNIFILLPLPENLNRRIEDGEFKMLTCHIINGILDIYNENTSNDKIENIYR